jgi:hypothetical protein
VTHVLRGTKKHNRETYPEEHKSAGTSGPKNIIELMFLGESSNITELTFLGEPKNISEGPEKANRGER